MPLLFTVRIHRVSIVYGCPIGSLTGRALRVIIECWWRRGRVPQAPLPPSLRGTVSLSLPFRRCPIYTDRPEFPSFPVDWQQIARSLCVPSCLSPCVCILLPISFRLPPSVCLLMFVSFCMSPSVCLPLTVSFYLSPSVCLLLSLSFCVSPTVCLLMFVSFFLSPSVCLLLSVSLCLSVCVIVSMSMPVYATRISAFVSFYLSACLLFSVRMYMFRMLLELCGGLFPSVSLSVCVGV